LIFRNAQNAPNNKVATKVKNVSGVILSFPPPHRRAMWGEFDYLSGREIIL
jgi:hypothetical protein